jgi:hypothetical protein
LAGESESTVKHGVIILRYLLLNTLLRRLEIASGESKAVKALRLSRLRPLFEEGSSGNQQATNEHKMIDYLVLNHVASSLAAPCLRKISLRDRERRWEALLRTLQKFSRP